MFLPGINNHISIMTKKSSILSIAASGLLSIIIATAWVNFGAISLGALIYLIVPSIIAIVTIILFFIVTAYIIESKTWVTITFIGINILTGIFMRLDFYYKIIGW